MIIKQGDQGAQVQELQKALNELNYGLKVDGIFGPMTHASVVSFQSSNGLDQDGIVGPLTEQAFLAAISGTPVSSPPIQSSPPPEPVSTGGPIYGIDDYHLDNVTDWNAVFADGKVFAMHKASQGQGADPLYASRQAGAKAAGLISGAYHFMNFNGDGADQADYFWNHIKANFAPEDLMPMMDWEYSGDQEPSLSDIHVSQAFTSRLLSLCGRKKLLLYIGWSHYQTVIDHGFGDWLNENFILELAQYEVSKPHGNYPWKFWQYSESGSVPGVHNPVDLDLFQGSLDDLKVLIKNSL